MNIDEYKCQLKNLSFIWTSNHICRLRNIDPQINRFNAWLAAFRLRTLPLAISGVGLGNFLAWTKGDFSILTCLFSMVTAVLLQVLSNLANDYGDSIHGADHSDRQGPKRTVQTGIISKGDMKSAILIFGVLSLSSGLILLWISFSQDWSRLLPFLAIGLMAIAAAYYYTNGKKPYGYMALGDVSVFLFFGLVAVLGSLYIQLKNTEFQQLVPCFLPATSIGLWSVAVLNLNNMRDMKSDTTAGKLTIPIVIGLNAARWYQTLLVLGGAITMVAFAHYFSTPILYGFGIGFLVMVGSLKGMWQSKNLNELDDYLKPQAIGTFLAVLVPFLIQIFCQIW